MTNLLKRVHQHILPPDLGTGLLPYVWLVYLAMFVMPLGFGERPDWHIWVSLAVLPIFLTLYFYTFWQSGFRVLLCIMAILAIGMATAWFNAGASVFFVYAAAFCVHLGNPKKALILVITIALSAGVYSYILAMPGYFYFPAIVISILIGFVNIYEGELRQKNRLLKHSQEELKLMAANAERERIARDLHDLIGHTFSLITVKAQLAYKLADVDLAKSKSEIKELENLSRSAMAEVRETVHNFQQKNMTSEIAKARLLTDSADIKLTTDIQFIPENEAVNSALAWVIREAFTNIIKHAEASECQLNGKKQSGHYLLMIQNDGPQNKEIVEGNGLKGLRERVTALNGTLTIETNPYFSIQVDIPYD